MGLRTRLTIPPIDYFWEDVIDWSLIRITSIILLYSLQYDSDLFVLPSSPLSTQKSLVRFDLRCRCHSEWYM